MSEKLVSKSLPAFALTRAIGSHSSDPEGLCRRVGPAYAKPDPFPKSSKVASIWIGTDVWMNAAQILVAYSNAVRASGVNPVYDTIKLDRAASGVSPCVGLLCICGAGTYVFASSGMPYVRLTAGNTGTSRKAMKKESINKAFENFMLRLDNLPNYRLKNTD